MTDESLAALGDEGYCENQVLPQTQFYSVSVLKPKFIVKSVGFWDRDEGVSGEGTFFNLPSRLINGFLLLKANIIGLQN